MTKVNEFKNHLQPGQVYRRRDLTKWSNAVDRHLKELQNDGALQKVAAGMYYYPKQSSFGPTPPTDHTLIHSYLKDDRFLVTSPNDYNKLGVGTTQLYNKVIVSNLKRSGDVKLGKRVYTFHRTPYFPDKVTPEFLLVDLVNRLDEVAEDTTAVLQRVAKKTKELPSSPLGEAVRLYGTLQTKKFFALLLNAP
ncbi:MAG TPA: DUF6088 family protein [Puia sp.]|jgi:hypothetical protein|nr:DUF6088 family protein [Puia sp.]